MLTGQYWWWWWRQRWQQRWRQWGGRGQWEEDGDQDNKVDEKERLPAGALYPHGNCTLVPTFPKCQYFLLYNERVFLGFFLHVPMFMLFGVWIFHLMPNISMKTENAVKHHNTPRHPDAVIFCPQSPRIHGGYFFQFSFCHLALGWLGCCNNSYQEVWMCTRHLKRIQREWHIVAGVGYIKKKMQAGCCSCMMLSGCWRKEECVCLGRSAFSAQTLRCDTV